MPKDAKIQSMTQKQSVLASFPYTSFIVVKCNMNVESWFSANKYMKLLERFAYFQPNTKLTIVWDVSDSKESDNVQLGSYQHEFLSFFVFLIK